MDHKIKEALKVLQKATANFADGDRHIVVLDRGWIFVGNILQDENGVYTVVNCKNIRKWSSGGFGGLSKSAKLSGAVLDDCDPIRFNARTMVFCVPIGDDWDEE